MVPIYHEPRAGPQLAYPLAPFTSRGGRGTPIATRRASFRAPPAKEDFHRINALLSRLVAVIEVELGEVSPRLKRLEAISPDGENAVFNFAMDAAREGAWLLAELLAPLPQEKWGPLIEAHDQVVADLGKLILHPGALAEGVIAWIREAESKDVAYNIQVTGG